MPAGAAPGVPLMVTRPGLHYQAIRLSGLPRSAVFAMAVIGRIFSCKHCKTQAVVCSSCDHGTVYCTPVCRIAGRRQAQRDAGRRYQNSRRGRHKHAARQQRYRERQQAEPKKVTHHPFHRRQPSVSIDPKAGTRRPEDRHQPAQALRCTLCGRICGRIAAAGTRPLRWGGSRREDHDD